MYHIVSHLWHHVAASQQMSFPKAIVIISAGQKKEQLHLTNNVKILRV